MKKKLILTLAVILTIAALAGCSGGKVTDSVAVSGIEERVDEVIGNDGSMVAVDSGYILNTIKLGDSDYAEAVVKINSYGVNIDEYGIFKGKDESQAKAIAKIVEEYFKWRDDVWMTEYMPEEYPKLQAAEYKVRGNYVIYTILGADESAAAFGAFEECLTEG